MIRICILFHEKETNPKKYVIHHLAKMWQEDGNEVRYIFGCKKFIPGDILILHVDLSVVPQKYIDYASKYPIALNNKISDIRKVAISENILSYGDPWDGPVVVKSNYNFYGMPERVYYKSNLKKRFEIIDTVKSKFFQLRYKGMPLEDIRQYKIYKSIKEIPKKWFSFQYAVIEKFIPEMENDVFHLRIAQVLGSRVISTRIASRDPIIKARKSIKTEEIEPDEIIAHWRGKYHLDYGKLDYVVNNGVPSLLDVNKTVGATSGYRKDSDLYATRKYIAEGIYDYL